MRVRESVLVPCKLEVCGEVTIATNELLEEKAMVEACKRSQHGNELVHGCELQTIQM